MTHSNAVLTTAHPELSKFDPNVSQPDSILMQIMTHNDTILATTGPEFSKFDPKLS